MNRHRVALSSLLSFLVLSTTLYGQGAAPNRSIVVLKLGANPDKVSRAHGVVPDHVYQHALNGFAAVTPPGILRKLQNDPDVAWIEADQVMVASRKKRSAPTQQPAQVIPYGIDRIDAIEVVNMSLGGGNFNALNAAIADSVAKGVVYVVAAGNSATDAFASGPANSSDVICVSAIADTDGLFGGLGSPTRYGSDDSFASFSNYGSVVDIAAPGVDVLSTYKGQTYVTMSGTSMASPHVAGAVALHLSGSVSKPGNAAAVAIVRTTVIGMGCDQGGQGGFSGDPDNDPEPVVDASSLKRAYALKAWRT